ncbi:MAG: PfkB family carbohydrate kinase [Chloroflexi bacterium]|nr:PfkB family carbohydrate kinase [Chloroflexota bacterium]
MPPVEPVDYLVIGHLTKDMAPEGAHIGGTAAYASLTARALGLRVGVVTACASDVSTVPLDGVQIAALSSDVTTTFENVYTPKGRIQHLYSVAPSLDYYLVPELWRNTPIVHLGPVAREVDLNLVRSFPDSFLGLTPQGWLRDWDAQRKVISSEWPEARYVLEKANAAVISIEDVDYDEDRIDEMAYSCHILVVTEAAAGARVYWNGDIRRFRPPIVEEIDPVGAGDVFAAAFFYRLHSTRDPWEAARFATQLAAISVTRRGLEGVPTQEEVQASMIEVF